MHSKNNSQSNYKKSRNVAAWRDFGFLYVKNVKKEVFVRKIRKYDINRYFCFV